MIFIVNGAPGAGKTTFEETVKKIMKYQTCYIISTIDPVKRIAKMVGWNGKKDLKSRKFLSDLKDLLTEWNDYSFNWVCGEVEYINKMNDYEDNIAIFIDCREPEEIKKLCTALGAKSLLIRRAGAENSETSNHADAQVLNYDYDIVIENDGNLLDFTNKAFDFVEEWNLDKKPGLTVNLFGEIVD